MITRWLYEDDSDSGNQGSRRRAERVPGLALRSESIRPSVIDTIRIY